MPPAAALPPPLERFATAHLGPLRCARPPRRPGSSATVWLLEPADPERGAAVLKLHRRGRAARQEGDALARWSPQLPIGAAPRLLARHPQLPALLLSHLPGEPPAVGGGRDPRHDHALGALLARLHAVPHHDDDPLPLAVALERRIVAALADAAPYLEADRAALEASGRALTSALEPLARCGGLVRVPCHRDVAPRNLLATPAGGVALIDFEHARADLWLVDLVELAGLRWRRRADLETAFWRGYGRTPQAAERDALAAVRALHALATVGWSGRRTDTRRQQVGRLLLAGARRELVARGYAGA